MEIGIIPARPSLYIENFPQPYRLTLSNILVMRTSGKAKGTRVVLEFSVNCKSYTGGSIWLFEALIVNVNIVLFMEINIYL